MNYDDEASKSFEEKFKEFLEFHKNFTEDDVKAIDKSLNDIVDPIMRLISNPNGTPEEEQFLKETSQKLKDLFEKVNDYQLLLGEKIFRDAKLIHEAIKKKAAEGDEHAIEAAKKLDASYIKMLESNLGRN